MGSRAPSQGRDARAGFVLLEHPGVCYPPKTAHVLSTNCFPTGRQSSWRRHWPSWRTQVERSWTFSAHHSSLCPQDGFLLCCWSVPSLVCPQEFSSCPGRTPCSSPPADPPIPSATIAGRKFRDCSSGEASVSKQSSFQNRTNKTKAKLSL